MFSNLYNVIWNPDSKNIKPISITENRGYLVNEDNIGKYYYIWDDVYDIIPINFEDFISPEEYAFNKYGYKHLDFIYNKLECRNIQILDIQSIDDEIKVCYVSLNRVLARSNIENFTTLEKFRNEVINEILD